MTLNYHFDDVIIYENNVKEHDDRLESALTRILEADWSLYSKKLKMFIKTILTDT